MKIASFCVKEVENKRTTKSHVLPIYPTSSFVFESVEQSIDIFSGKEEGHKYSRYGNPTSDAVAQKIADLESFGLEIEAEGLLCGTGMSAISTLLLSLVKEGDGILTQGNIYGGTTELFMNNFGRLGIKTHLQSLNDITACEATLKNDDSIKLIYLETPANPSLACIDLEKIVALAKSYNCITVIDNTFCTPLLQQPFKYGVDYVIHSTTKFINGHGNSLSGAIIFRKDDERKKDIWNSMKLLGTPCAPFDAWLIHNGMKTLALRMKKHCENGQLVAEFLEGHEKIIKVNYPGLASHPDHEIACKQMKNGFGAMLSFEIDSDIDGMKRFMNQLQLAVMAPTLGDVDTLVLHPATSSHLNIDKEIRIRNGITDGLVRISIGIEDIADITEDLAQALEVV